MTQEPGKRSKDPYDKARTIRVNDDLWNDFGQAAGEGNRARILNDFIAWYLRRTRAVMPKRPPREEWQPDKQNP